MIKNLKAIIIKSNPKYINNSIAQKYYKEIEKFLKDNGVSIVEFNDGKEYTIPKLDADIYIGHSKGCDRYEHMPKDKQKVFLKFGVIDGIIDPIDLKWQKEEWTIDTDKQPPKEHFILFKDQKEAILNLIKKVKNIYQESNSTFESNGITYDLNYFWKETHNDPVLQIDVNLIKWVLDYDKDNSKEDKIRTDNTDLSAPLLITNDNNKELVIDGLHRLKKAISLNIKTLPYKRVNKKMFDGGIIKISNENINIPLFLKW
jgi:hypothetical protein